ncbi:ArsR/SmtB family transcription factor, partial [Streptacidiphilus pinicola]|uniref:ArsR/SmtB family transcription factor n=1 Tax=Streptacidiphilus pinicola TaxID=2219663 RepID=UPI001A9FC78F
MSTDPSEDVQQIDSAEQHAALAHPLRQRLLFTLKREPSTISRLAAQLGVNKGSVSHHLKVLREAGLVQAAGSRQVRGGTEQYYRVSARRLLVQDPQPEGTAALLGAVAQELDRSPVEHTLTLRHLRLGPAKAA